MKGGVNELPGRLKAACAARRMPQAVLAAKVGVTPTYVSLICTGKRVPSVQMLVAMARVLNFTVSDLLGETALVVE